MVNTGKRDILRLSVAILDITVNFCIHVHVQYMFIIF